MTKERRTAQKIKELDEKEPMGGLLEQHRKERNEAKQEFQEVAI